MNFQKNNPVRLFYGALFLTFLIVGFNACSKETVLGPPTSLTEMASGISIAHADTSLVLSWSPGLAAWEGKDRPVVTLSYEVQVSTDETFRDESQIALDFVVDSTSLFLNDEQLTPLQQYYARVRTAPSTGTGHSAWTAASSFQLRPIDMFRPIKVWNLTDEAAILGWGRHGEMATLVVETADGNEKQEFDIKNATLVSKLVEGLLPGKSYVAKLLRQDNRSLGVLAFTTKPDVTGAGYVDLRASSDPSILQTTLNTVSAGSKIVLKRGMTYAISTAFQLNRDVTIMSEPGFGAQAQIQMSPSFGIEEGAQITLLKFDDVEIRGTLSSSYVLNLSPASSIQKVEFEACRISDHVGVMRLQGAGVKSVQDYVINNSIIQNIGAQGVLQVDNVNAVVNNVHLTNSTFINTQWIVRYNSSVVNHLNAMTIESSTFFQAPYDNRYILDMARTGSTIGSFTANNTLFGYTGGARSFNSRTPASISVTNSFATADATWGTSNTQALIAGIVRYPFPSEQVFAMPDKTNFANSDLTIIDEALFTVGDPKWRP
ncbi:DUF4957 domain-containing protein [Sphingobacterium griseoflavum]|uniref:Fibronectin type-III domain-containing protein n=1 Tax=Sphingobacterium griseoflavum TaxID=1474952 RepID=A0ABQ3I091_9SPHI|nr:DUF4957 domain-containing protein [Sphingobacterium griseoflavum]GHE41435.1 hypothetical protein GCM10017764_26030 [Sphingobacterium griseoflavum]